MVIVNEHWKGQAMSKATMALVGALIGAAVIAAAIEPPLWALALIAVMAWATLALVLWSENRPRYRRRGDGR